MKLKRMLFKMAAILPAVALMSMGVAHAQMAGPKLISAFGGIDEASEGEGGHLVIAGSTVLTNQGGATALNVTIGIQDSDNEDEGTTCSLTQPGDLSYSFPNGLNSAGTMTLTVNALDSCWETNDPSYSVGNTGNSVTFTLYARNGSGSMVGTATTLQNEGGDTLGSPVAVAGTVQAASGGQLNVLSGSHLFNAVGGTTDDSGESGHMGIAGLAVLNTGGGANGLDVTLSYQDSNDEGLACELTNPADLSYSLTKGVGTLTLTVSSADSATCAMGTGNSITFNLYAVGGQARIISTSSSLQDNYPDIIDDPAVVGTF